MRVKGPVVVAGHLLGCGLGAFFDGILLHQVLQWHNMLSSVRAPVDLVSMKYNMLWDGVFHAFAWFVTVAGVWALWYAAKRPEVRLSTPAFGGSLLLGWGLFNALEGLVNHQWLGLHHVHPGAQEGAWDAAFVVWGLSMCVAGALLLSRRSGVERVSYATAIGQPRH